MTPRSYDRLLSRLAAVTAVGMMTLACQAGQTTARSVSISNPVAPTGANLKVAAPTPAAPASGVRTETLSPTLVFQPSQASFTTATFTYRLELYSAAGELLYTTTLQGGSTTTLQEGGNVITHEYPGKLESDTTYRWRVRPELDGATGPWSPMAEFVTMIVIVETRGMLPPGPYPADGATLANMVGARWPEYLDGPVPMETREHNMEFLRDRLIEVALCAGMNVGWNLKRGIGPHSHDAIAWYDKGSVEVVDIALAFKDPSKPMSMHWNIAPGPPGFDRYTNEFKCR